MSAAAHSNPPTAVSQLTQKLYDADSDIRFMSLHDLYDIFNSNTASAFLHHDYQACAKLVDGFMKTLNDPNGEVQNLTVKCLGPFSVKANPDILCPAVNKICDLTSTESVDSSISALAMRAVVVALPRPGSASGNPKQVNDAYSAVSKVLIPRLVGYKVVPSNEKIPELSKGLLQIDLETGNDSSWIEVLTEIAHCFGPMLHPNEAQALQKITVSILESDKSGSVLKKKAVTALSALAQYFSDALLSSATSHMIEGLRTPHLTPAKRRLYITIFGAMARAIPGKFGPHLKTLAPFVLSALSQEELDEEAQAAEDGDGDRSPEQDEVREAALITLESFWSSCPADMQRYADDSLDGVLRFLKHDPLFAGMDLDEDMDDDDEDDEFDGDEDFEEEGVADDEDDISWKVRRCAARTLSTLISARGPDLLESTNTHSRIGKALVERFSDREDMVRLEILNTAAHLIRQSRDEDVSIDAQGQPTSTLSPPTAVQNRKRRRADSDASMRDVNKYRRLTGSCSPESTSAPSHGATVNLTRIGSDIVKGSLKAIKSSSAASRLAVVVVIKDLVIALQGGLGSDLDSVVDFLVQTLQNPTAGEKGASTSTSAAQTSGIQSETLHAIAEISKTHSSKNFQKHIGGIIKPLIKIMQSNNVQLASEALLTAEQLVKALTPPRVASESTEAPGHLEQIVKAITELISGKNVDVHVRQQALQTLGIILGRTLGSNNLLKPQTQKAAFQMLSDSCKNEVLRYASIKAIDAIASSVTDESDLDEQWFATVCLELAAQLRKADRSLRTVSLLALQKLLAQPSSKAIKGQQAGQLVSLVNPLLVTNDLTLIGPALYILAAIIRSVGKGLAFDEVINNICALVLTPAASSVLDQLCEFTEAAGETDVRKKLMPRLLKDVGVGGSPAVVGKLIGTLLVAGQGQTGFALKDFLKELDSATDPRRKCLALAIIGEVGLRSGSSSSIQPALFLKYFTSDSEEVRLTAGVALGRAAAGPGNVAAFTKEVLSRSQKDVKEQNLVLHAIKEMLQYTERESEVLPFADQLWDAAIGASRLEDNRTIGAECVAHLTMIKPRAFLPTLQTLLNDAAVAMRGAAILAFRDVFTITDVSYDKYLRPIIIDVLKTMLRDEDIENRRSALNTFNAAIRNKLPLIYQSLTQLVPLVMDHSHIDPSLVREVSMGPFKHKVDDGLETRKSAYETLYSIMELTPARIDTVKLYDRVVAGIDDEQGIRTLCHLMITRLTISAPDETANRLDAMTDKFQPILEKRLKDTAVRHEVEKNEEAKRSVVKISLELAKALPDATAAQFGKWVAYLEMLKGSYGPLVRDVEKELKDKERVW